MVMRWKCPHCEESCRIRSSKQPHENYRVVYLQCMNPECGWAGKGSCEIIRTISPSGMPKADKYQDNMAEHVPYQYQQPSQDT